MRNLERLGITRREANWAALPLRLIVGFGFFLHGYAKFQNGPDHFGAMLGAMGAPAPEFLGWATILLELLGGLAMIMGAFVTLVSMPLTVILAVAIFTVHLPYGFSSIKLQSVTPAGAKFGPPGYEVDLLYIAAMAALAIGGSGPFSVDFYLKSVRLKKDSADPRK